MIEPREVDRPLVLYGYGRLGHLAEEIFKEINIKHHGVFTKDKGIQHIDVAPRERDEFLIAVCIASEPYTPIAESLKAQGYTDIVPVWDVLEFYADRTGIHNGWFVGNTITKTEQDAIRFISKKFDFESRDHYSRFRFWRQYRCEVVPPISIKNDEYASLPSALADIRARQHMQKYMLGVQGEEVIHNEGYELQTIQESMAVFQKDRPRLQVACYHSKDGLWKIQKTLMDNLPDYRWTFRLHAYQGQAAYLYGVPKERV